ncbi:MAG: glycosyltransferase family 4 protein [Solirubrobacteraceae bacterium]
MHVGLNLVYLVPGETGGMEVYARELIPALLAAAGHEWKFTAFVSREAAAADGPWSEMPSVGVPVHSANRAAWVYGEQALLPRLAAQRRVDLVHSLATTAPGWGPFRRVTTIHDLHYRTVPEAHFGVRSLGMRALVPLAARRSHRVIAISQATRDDIVALLHVPPGRIDVIHQGLGRRRRTDARPPRGLDAGDRPLLLTAAAKRPHKNLGALLDALALLPTEQRPVLVLPGYATPYEATLKERAAALGVASEVRFLGWVDDAEMEWLYAAATAFVFPSLAEGFGLPVLEAMARGLPVACSNRPPLTEVAADAALTFDPGSPRAIADAVVRLLGDRSLRERLRARGTARAAAFNWSVTAERTLASYRRALAR